MESQANPIPDSSPPVQSPVDATDEEETPSMRGLVRDIDVHVEAADPEVTSNIRTGAEFVLDQTPPTTQTTRNGSEQLVTPPTPIDHAV